jgi:hypothetical protein
VVPNGEAILSDATATLAPPCHVGRDRQKHHSYTPATGTKPKISLAVEEQKIDRFIEGDAKGGATGGPSSTKPDGGHRNGPIAPDAGPLAAAPHRSASFSACLGS